MEDPSKKLGILIKKCVYMTRGDLVHRNISESVPINLRLL